MVRPKKAKLADLLAEHFDELPDVTQKHVEDSHAKLRAFAAWLEHQPTTHDLTTQSISGFMRHLATAGLSAYTVNHHRAVILITARRADDQGLIVKVPRVRKMKEPLRIPRGYTVDEMGRILAACRSAPSRPQRNKGYERLGTWTGAEWEILIRLVWESGARPTSLFTLRFDDVRDGYYNLQAENTKTFMEKSDKLSLELLELIERRRIERAAKPDERILVWPCNRRFLWVCLQRDVLKPAGVKGALYETLKGATSYVAKEKGIFAAAQFRGHMNAETTQRHYVDPRIARTTQAAHEILPAIVIPATHHVVEEPPEDPAILAIANNGKNGEERMREICALDPARRDRNVWDSVRWGKLLGVTSAAVRDYQFWDELKGGAE